MKTIFMILVLVAGSATAQSKFETAIFKGKDLLKAADTQEAYTACANYFERIARKETGEWLPLYYQSLSLTLNGAEETDTDTKEKVLNDALVLVQQAKKLDKNSEVVALEGFVQMMRLTVDPATRGQTLAPTIYALFGEAMAMDAENPRAQLLMGQMEFGTARFFGSGFEKACGYIQSAYDIFGGTPDEPTILPTWGMKMAEASLAYCNQ
ncbi:MAG: hypothetical protein RIC30_14615 [Marinoscillum sp.]|uniref:hypothetical protein n=1 Tax=Marinoscillum sp. TaxID=2024838 RepID=UPI0032F8BCA2